MPREGSQTLSDLRSPALRIAYTADRLAERPRRARVHGKQSRNVWLPLPALGRISYGVYLYHLPLLAVAIRVGAFRGRAQPHPASVFSPNRMISALMAPRAVMIRFST
jgi:hypothetical protein